MPRIGLQMGMPFSRFLPEAEKLRDYYLAIGIGQTTATSLASLYLTQRIFGEQWKVLNKIMVRGENNEGGKNNEE